MVDSPSPPTSFERQLLNYRVGNKVIVVANIYRRPSSSKTTFFDEFTDLLSALCLQAGDRLLICGDLNLPGRIGGELDDDFADLLDQLGLVQHVQVTTHFDAAINRSNILDLVITSETSHLVSTASVVTSHHLSDYSLVICDIRLKRIKIVAPTRSVRNIKAIDKVDFVRRHRESSLFTGPAITVDAFTDQMERVTTELLDAVAPLRAVHHKFAPARQLSLEAVAAKRDRLVKERQ